MNRVAFCAALFSAMAFVLPESAAQNPEFNGDPWEVRLAQGPQALSDVAQRAFRDGSVWHQTPAAQAGWRVQAHENRVMPARMYGPGQVLAGDSPQSKALAAWDWALGSFGFNSDDLGDVRTARGSKHDRVFATQQLEGLPVLGAKLQAKFRSDRLVMVGSDWWSNLQPVPSDPALTQATVLQVLQADMAVGEGENVGTTYLSDFNHEDLGMAWLPVQASQEGQAMWNAHPVWQVEIQGRRGVIPVRYLTWIDMSTGAVVLRQNQVMHESGHSAEAKTRRMGHVPGITQPVLPVFGQLKANVHPAYPYDDQEAMGMPHLELPLNGTSYFTDSEGLFNTDVSQEVADVPVQLRGLFATVFTNGVTPIQSTTFVNDFNNLTAPGNVKETSAYRSTNLVHDHMRTWLPEFGDLDFSMPVNIDVAGECNAFYDGSSINFYDVGGGCNATSLIADVVYHEYGHAINDFFYQSYFANFSNGAMNEGYADLWAMSLGNIAEIGKGFYTDNQDGIRRYDIDPKVYPEDIVGEVHADGEIICGAWYDTHLLLGGDWAQTMPLFVDAFPGLQATVPNGFEGQAYTDVLLDVLQADDDDDDLLNGTPNAAAIIEGFDIHGIRLFSYVELEHTPVEFTPAETTVTVEAEANIVFPYVTYFDSMRLHYRLTPSAPWTVAPMGQDNNLFTHDIPGVAAGTVIEYYIDILDVFGGISATTPVAADKAVNGNLPNYVLVGVESVLRDDLDEYSDFGNWDMDLPTDNATTGIWTAEIPVGSMGDVNDPSTVVAPLQDHTQGFFGFAFITGLSGELGDGIGANDVDGGHTTLVSPVIDLTPYENPVMTYWRWYANAPATGANPASDWWQVEVTNDGGNTWQYLENTLQQDISWRRKAFRVADVIEPTDAFQMRFIASDSTTIGEYLDGGSLVEAALDDIILYDLGSGDDVGETGEVASVHVLPNPASHEATLRGWMPGSSVRVHDLQGREVALHRANGVGQARLDVSTWPVGVYSAIGWDGQGEQAQVRLEVVR